MANTRIKDISTAATTLNSDDFIAVDGSTAGTRKMAKADLITEVSTGVSGTYLEESNNLSDVASKDTSKLNLEVPDVGTGPQEVPLNSMLSGMAYMSPDSVAVDDLEVTGKLDIDSSGNVSIGAGDVANNGSLHVYRSSATADLNLQSAGGSGRSYALQSKADGNLVIRDNNAAADRWSINSSGSLVSGASEQPIDLTGNGILQAASNLYLRSTGSSPIIFQNGSATRWTIDTSGNFVSSGGGIDFGAVASGTGTVVPTTGGTLDDFERGSFTPSFTSTGTAPTLTYLQQVGTYTKVGNLVTCHGRVRVNAVTGAGTGSLQISGLPFATQNVSNLGSGGSVCLAAFFGTSSSGCPTHLSGANNATVMTFKTLKNSAGVVASLDNTDAADLAGNCYVDFSVTYTTA